MTFGKAFRQRETYAATGIATQGLKQAENPFLRIFRDARAVISDFKQTVTAAGLRADRNARVNTAMMFKRVAE